MTHKISENKIGNPTIVLSQVKDIIKSQISFELHPSPSGPGFFGVADDLSKTKGILSVKAALTLDDQILVELGIFKLIEEPVAPFKVLLGHISNLGERVWLQQNENDFFEVVFKVDPAPMGVTRMGSLKQKIEEISAIAEFLQETVKQPSEDFVKLTEQYKKVKSILSPVYPLGENFEPGPEGEGCNSKEIWLLIISFT